MGKEKQMVVGHLPSLTWNKLDMNGGRVPSGWTPGGIVPTSFRGLPAGISHRRLTAAQAQKWLSENAPGEEAEKFVAGKIPVYHPQRFGTGLGAEFDEALAAGGIKTDLVEVEAGAQVEQPISWHFDVPEGSESAAAQIVHLGEGSSLILLLESDSGNLLGQARRKTVTMAADSLKKAANVTADALDEAAARLRRAARQENFNYADAARQSAGTDTAAEDSAAAVSGQDNTVVQRQKASQKGSAGSFGSIFSVSTKIVMERGAKLTLVRAQALEDSALYLDDLGIAMAQDAEVTLITADLGAANSYIGIQIEQIGDRSKFTGKMAYLAAGDQKKDINYNAIQRGRGTESRASFDGVLADRGEKSFRGTIDFRNGSVGSIGDEQENVLLLDPDIVNKTLPVILCEEEDVEGRHGATVGRLADDMLFYMASRGIDEKQAEQIMVRARLGAVLREIPDEKLQKKLRDYVEEAFHDESLS